MRALFESIRARHPVALGFFVIAGEVVVFPRVRPPAARGLAPAAGYPRFEELSTAAENQELWLRKPEFALDTYRAAKELDVPPPLKALAEARIAHCLQKLGRTAEARRQYQIVWERYGGEYDPSCPALFRTGSSSEAPGRFRY